MAQSTKIDWCDYIPRGKRVFTKKGYVIVYCPEHPNANKGSNKYIFEHRLVMSNHLKRPLHREEFVHHINGIKSDNRIENLLLTTNEAHMQHHSLHMSKDHKRKFVSGGRKYANTRKKSRALVPCACGCGEMIECHDSKGRTRKFKHGHNARGTHWKWGDKSDG